MHATVRVLCEFFERELDRLADSYQWKIPFIAKFTQVGEHSYQANLMLKHFLHEQWQAADADQRLQLAKVIVSDWGGVRSNKPETLERYVGQLSEPQPATPLKGVASYSKIFSIAFPQRYAIYDARVAACLNAVQINAGERNGIAFNYVQGRNNIVGHAIKRIGFAHMPDFSVRTLQQRGWARIRRDETYARYSELLSSCLRALPGWSLQELEMALFANAEQECMKAMAREQ